jgi:aconitase A|tara:strand:+ start:424 stop:714 length:291 start_codon:yes stop_codon:yes gene_type:complete
MQVKLIVFKEDYKCIIGGVEEVYGADIGEPDCEITKPYEFIIQDDDFEGEYKDRLKPWNVMNISSQKKCRIQSDSILTLVDPEPFILQAYNELISE